LDPGFVRVCIKNCQPIRITGADMSTSATQNNGQLNLSGNIVRIASSPRREATNVSAMKT
jgi:L-asparaginase/Glu-tRNA(Gln) amidotransferase subunit D